MGLQDKMPLWGGLLVKTSGAYVPFSGPFSRMGMPTTELGGLDPADLSILSTAYSTSWLHWLAGRS